MKWVSAIEICEGISKKGSISLAFHNNSFSHLLHNVWFVLHIVVILLGPFANYKFCLPLFVIKVVVVVVVVVLSVAMISSFRSLFPLTHFIRRSSSFFSSLHVLLVGFYSFFNLMAVSDVLNARNHITECIYVCM